MRYFNHVINHACIWFYLFIDIILVNLKNWTFRNFRIMEKYFLSNHIFFLTFQHSNMTNTGFDYLLINQNLVNRRQLVLKLFSKQLFTWKVGECKTFKTLTLSIEGVNITHLFFWAGSIKKNHDSERNYCKNSSPDFFFTKGRANSRKYSLVFFT